MKSDGSAGKIYQVIEWITKLAYLQLLWLLFSLAGLVIFGFMPSTISMFSVIRKWLMNDTNLPVFRTFATTFKKEFAAANGLGLLIGAAGFILYIDYQYVSRLEGLMYFAAMVLLTILLLLYLIMLMYLVPVFVHYRLAFKQYMTHSLFIGIANPLITILMAGGAAGCYLLFLNIQGLIPFFSGPVFAFVLMWGSLRSFAAIAAKQKNKTAEKDVNVQGNEQLTKVKKQMVTSSPAFRKE
ncbi:YesL family protein [Halobacillus salinarum]|uniref:YesL family protein n=1 Tax=Halobacillus salinarum TaxID=2932257 RepID=A0ABY4EI31_9BACI|nr:YesL family protein [Halobacillus salinarum]UOQ44138.1 YesL family protein [Halobacillus salinarum]